MAAKRKDRQQVAERPSRPRKPSRSAAEREGLRKFFDRGTKRWRDVATGRYTSEPVRIAREERRYERELAAYRQAERERKRLEALEAERRAEARRARARERARERRRLEREKREAEEKRRERRRERDRARREKKRREKERAERRREREKARREKLKQEALEAEKKKREREAKTLKGSAREIREYLREVLDVMCTQLGTMGYSCHWSTAITAEGAVDSDFRLEPLPQNVDALVLDIEDTGLLPRQSNLWISIGVEINTSDANAIGFKYPVRDRGTHRLWTWPVRAPDVVDAFRIVRDNILPANRDGAPLSDAANAIIVRIHWNPENRQPGRRPQ